MQSPSLPAVSFFLLSEKVNLGFLEPGILMMFFLKKRAAQDWYPQSQDLLNSGTQSLLSEGKA